MVVGMTLDIDELRRLEAASTGGPWTFYATRGGASIQSATYAFSVFANDADIRFICAARNALPELLDLVDRLLTHERCHTAGIDANTRELLAMDAAEIKRLRAKVRELEAERDRR